MPAWQKILKDGFASSKELLHFLDLSATLSSDQAEKQFKTRVPRAFAALMEPGNRYDPLLLQVLAVDEEMQPQPGFDNDPLHEAASNPIPGLLHKYQSRVLLTLTSACAINCRYCFRRHFPYQENNPGLKGWTAALDYIANDPSIHEVILSGGDPLLAKDTILEALFKGLEAIPHLRTLRIHSRIPVVLPERIDDRFLALLRPLRLQKVMVIHSNHPNELDARVERACLDLQAAGFVMLNQSVLLAGVNDDAQTLAKLSERLFACNVLPYYLHLLDKVQGAKHFDVSMEQALTVFKDLQRLLPGYLVPRLAKEEAGMGSKTLVVS